MIHSLNLLMTVEEVRAELLHDFAANIEGEMRGSSGNVDFETFRMWWQHHEAVHWAAERQTT